MLLIRAALVASLVLGTILLIARPRSVPSSTLAFFETRVADESLVLEGEGTLEPETELVVTTPADLQRSQVEQIVAEGTRVKKGDFLCRVTTFRIEEEERNAREELSKKEAEFKRMLEEGTVAAADDLKKSLTASEELAYNRCVATFLESGPDPRLVRTLKLKIQRARLAEVNLTSRTAAQQALVQRGYVSEQDYESLKTELRKAELDRLKQENLLVLRSEGPSADERRRGWTLCKKSDKELSLARRSELSQARLRDLATDKKKMEIQDKQAALEEKAKQRKRAVLTAPLDGIVLYPDRFWSRSTSPGSPVWGGMSLLRIAQPEKLRTKVKINERWIDRVLVGQKALVRAAHRPESFPAVVSSISRLATKRDDEAKSPRDFTVELKLSSGTGRLWPNMSCRAVIEIARHPGVVRAPVDLVRRRKGSDVELQSLQGGLAVPIKARLVDEDRDFVYLTGLRGGERLLY
ncbi:MAG: HlyD family efflux transporter periplasmic adaptor subunit [Candidatus Riflebacteria bacterium]|nr:HlyD family efflux transporter periplasmic adaptor subunit [Candidatus Riflebacteria bacterium]